MRREEAVTWRDGTWRDASEVFLKPQSIQVLEARKSWFCQPYCVGAFSLLICKSHSCALLEDGQFVQRREFVVEGAVWMSGILAGNHRFTGLEGKAVRHQKGQALRCSCQRFWKSLGHQSWWCELRFPGCMWGGAWRADDAHVEDSARLIERWELLDAENWNVTYLEANSPGLCPPLVAIVAYFCVRPNTWSTMKQNVRNKSPLQRSRFS